MQREIDSELYSCLTRRELVVLATVVSGPSPGNQMLIWPRGETLGDLGSPRLNQRAALYAEQIIPDRESGRKTFRWDDNEIDAFFEVLTPPPELIAIGAVHVAIPLIQFARILGFRTVVIDPREAFATQERFDQADEIHVAWPDQALPRVGLHDESFVAILSHDLKIDLPALKIALRSPARYVGVLGSKKTQAKRLVALREEGFDDDDFARIHSPIGLDLGGRRAEEIALSVVAEMIAVSHGR